MPVKNTNGLYCEQQVLMTSLAAIVGGLTFILLCSRVVTPMVNRF